MSSWFVKYLVMSSSNLFYVIKVHEEYGFTKGSRSKKPIIAVNNIFSNVSTLTNLLCRRCECDVLDSNHSGIPEPPTKPLSGHLTKLITFRCSRVEGNMGIGNDPSPPGRRQKLVPNLPPSHPSNTSRGLMIH